MSSIAPILAVAPSRPDRALVRDVVNTVQAGGVIAFPTDTLYGIGCAFGQQEGVERIQRMRGFDRHRRPLTFLLPDLGVLPHWIQASESAYRILSRIFPGPYCAELLASPRVPPSFTNPDRRTIGVRVPDNALCEQILWQLGRPMLTATAKSRAGANLTSAQDIQREYGGELDLILDAGLLAGPPSTVVSLIDDWVTILREGRGPANKILLT
jgi:tRNA threonylcarbamoyl adenosine modification protein (Sua5/YciO/YrdC/YwlC family)